MKRKGISIGIISGIVLVLVIVATQSIDSKTKAEEIEILNQADIIMPTKVSRPGCEETNSCYIPSVFSIKLGEQVTWSNEDVAFHSVTSGIYGEPSALFDSGHLDPGEKFSVSFDEKGVYDYFCTLHPWMEGKVIVE